MAAKSRSGRKHPEPAAPKQLYLGLGGKQQERFQAEVRAAEQHRHLSSVFLKQYLDFPPKGIDSRLAELKKKKPRSEGERVELAAERWALHYLSFFKEAHQKFGRAPLPVLRAGLKEMEAEFFGLPAGQRPQFLGWEACIAAVRELVAAKEKEAGERAHPHLPFTRWDFFKAGKRSRRR